MQHDRVAMKDNRLAIFYNRTTTFGQAYVWALTAKFVLNNLGGLVVQQFERNLFLLVQIEIDAMFTLKSWDRALEFGACFLELEAYCLEFGACLLEFGLFFLCGVCLGPCLTLGLAASNYKEMIANRIACSSCIPSTCSNMTSNGLSTDLFKSRGFLAAVSSSKNRQKEADNWDDHAS
jgi:hypothetical protein